MAEFLTEKEVRAFARDEWARLARERQAACKHAYSGTIYEDAVVRCDQCDKALTEDDVHFEISAALSPVEQKHVKQTRGEK